MILGIGAQRTPVVPPCSLWLAAMEEEEEEEEVMVVGDDEQHLTWAWAGRDGILPTR